MRQLRPVESEQRFLEIFEKQLSARFPGLSWKVDPEAPRAQWDAIAVATWRKCTLRFCVEVKLFPTAGQIEAIANRPVPKGWFRLLAAPNLPDSLMARCRQLGLPCMDLNGRFWLEAEPVLIDQCWTSDERYGPPTSGRDYFSGKASRVPRALFARQHWTHGELVDETGADGAQVSRVLNAMIADGLVARDGPPGSRGAKFFATDRDHLLDAWAARDPWPRRVDMREYSTLLDSVEGIAQNLRAAIPGAAFTQWFAAAKRRPYADVPVVSAYVRELPSEETLKPLFARPVAAHGRLRLLLPDDQGVFQFTRVVDGLTLVSDAQIYLDVVRAGLRGDEAAKALRNWTEFCR